MLKQIVKKSYDWIGSALGVGFSNGKFQFLWGGTPTASGVTVTPDTALKTIAVQRCVSLISGTLAMAPIYGYKVRTKRTYAPTAVEVLFNTKANPQWSGFTYRCFAWQQVLLWGAHYAQKVKNKQGDVIALWPLPASQMARKFTASGRNVYYERTVNGRVERYPEDAIFYLPYLIVDENGNGLSVITAHAESIGANQAALRHSATYFKQGARMTGVLKMAGSLSDEAYAKLRTAWEESQTPENAHRAVILEEGMDFTPISVNPQDSQLLETQVHNDEQVAMMFGTPPSMIGLTSKSTSWGTGIEQQVLGWQKFTIGPLGTQLQACAQLQLVTEPNVELRHDYSELLKPDFNTLSTALSNLHRGGLITSNEGREMLDYDPHPDGEKLLVQMQMVPIGDAGQQISGGSSNATNPSV